MYTFRFIDIGLKVIGIGIGTGTGQGQWRARVALTSFSENHIYIHTCTHIHTHTHTHTLTKRASYLFFREPAGGFVGVLHLLAHVVLLQDIDDTAVDTDLVIINNNKILVFIYHL
jgi:hypothetical protein